MRFYIWDRYPYASLVSVDLANINGDELVIDASRPELTLQYENTIGLPHVKGSYVQLRLNGAILVFPTSCFTAVTARSDSLQLFEAMISSGNIGRR